MYSVTSMLLGFIRRGREDSILIFHLVLAVASLQFRTHFDLDGNYSCLCYFQVKCQYDKTLTFKEISTFSLNSEMLVKHIANNIQTTHPIYHRDQSTLAI